MTLNRRQLSKAFISTGLLAASPWLGAQGAFPSKQIKIVVPTPPGGNLDFMARVLAEKLSTVVGQTVIVENRSGASSSIGTRYVAQSTPDGTTLLIGANTFASTPAIMPSAGYDPVKDFTGVTMLARMPSYVMVPTSSPYRTLGELIAAARAKPGEVTYASAGAGSVSRLATERMAHQLGLKMVNVPFKGNGDALIDLMAGRVAMLFDQYSSSSPHIKAGKLRALATTASTRSAVLPEVPTFAEAGVNDFEDYVWIGFLLPAATPKDIVARWNAATVKVLQMPDVKTRFTASGLDVQGNSPEEFNTFYRSEVVRLNKLAQAANIKME